MPLFRWHDVASGALWRRCGARPSVLPLFSLRPSSVFFLKSTAYQHVSAAAIQPHTTRGASVPRGVYTAPLQRLTTVFKAPHNGHKAHIQLDASRTRAVLQRTDNRALCDPFQQKSTRTGQAVATCASVGAVVTVVPEDAPVDTTSSCIGFDPSQGSYAQALLQHIKDGASGVNSEKGMTSEWFVDYLLSLKLAMGVPWCVALPAAGCLLRLLTLPIAIDSERDRRQRQLVDPQFSRMKAQMKAAYETGNTEEFRRLRAETKLFLKKHSIGALPTSLLQMLLLGAVFSVATPAIKKMGAHADDWKDFAFEQPAWLESLALPDASGLTALICWLVLTSTVVAGWLVTAKIQRQNPLGIETTGGSQMLGRALSIGFATLFAGYSGTQLPAAALLFLVPAFGLQSVLMRIFRIRSVERAFYFVPEGLRPLQQTYLTMVQRRQPDLVAEFKRQSALNKEKLVSGVAPDAAAETSSALVQFWRESALRSGLPTATQAPKTWAEHVAACHRRAVDGQHIRVPPRTVPVR